MEIWSFWAPFHTPRNTNSSTTRLGIHSRRNRTRREFQLVSCHLEALNYTRNKKFIHIFRKERELTCLTVGLLLWLEWRVIREGVFPIRQQGESKLSAWRKALPVNLSAEEMMKVRGRATREFFNSHHIIRTSHHKIGSFYDNLNQLSESQRVRRDVICD